MSPEQFNSAVLAWYDQHGRKDLPWQQNITPVSYTHLDVYKRQPSRSAVRAVENRP